MKPAYDDRPFVSQSSTFLCYAELYLTAVNKAARYNNESRYEWATRVIPQAVLIACLTVTTQNTHTTASEVSCPSVSLHQLNIKLSDKK
jgi:hypothetical protein